MTIPPDGPFEQKAEIIESEILVAQYPPRDDRYEVWRFIQEEDQWRFTHNVFFSRDEAIAFLKTVRQPHFRVVHFVLE